MATKHRQRVIVPGGSDRVTCPTISREKFNDMSWDTLIHLGGEIFVHRRDCFWSEQKFTFSISTAAAERLGLQYPTETEIAESGKASSDDLPQTQTQKIQQEN